MSRCGTLRLDETIGLTFFNRQGCIGVGSTHLAVSMAVDYGKRFAAPELCSEMRPRHQRARRSDHGRASAASPPPPAVADKNGRPSPLAADTSITSAYSRLGANVKRSAATFISAGHLDRPPLPTPKSGTLSPAPATTIRAPPPKPATMVVGRRLQRRSGKEDGSRFDAHPTQSPRRSCCTRSGKPASVYTRRRWNLRQGTRRRKRASTKGERRQCVFSSSMGRLRSLTPSPSTLRADGPPADSRCNRRECGEAASAEEQQ